ncbi:MAG: formylglycine-generating enzyme family protein [Gemmatimonadetes bacterium]|jgi:formylglycine-generating enzyme required for sulfatase activity|nr:formylglycine-generating enzyme family protein [Gemmatimonadota bacterium]
MRQSLNAIAYVACLALIIGCAADKPTQPGGDVLAPAAKGAKKGKSKVSICHIDEEGVFHLISVAEPAVDAHLAHGDEIAGGDVLDENCEPVFQEEITIDLSDGVTLEMVWIEPGTFLMGSPESEQYRFVFEGPQHEVTISQGFYLGKYEVTQEQWEVVMGEAPWLNQRYVQVAPDNPASWISWNDMQIFIGKLNAAAGEEIYRFPTEAEWEYASRAGTTTPWSFGDDETQMGNYMWYYSNTFPVGEAYSHAVGSKLPNPWGLYDMHGNVWEWCQDWFGDYSSEAQIDPTGAESNPNNYRVGRSGSFAHGIQYVRSASRGTANPEHSSHAFGARLLRTK